MTIMSHRYLLSLHFPSRCLGFLANLRWRWLKNLLIRGFIWAYKIDLSELQRQDINQYQHFNDFFTRELKPAARSTTPYPDKIVSPVDGTISEFGTIEDGKLLQAKQIYYDVATLIGGNHDDSALLQRGQFITLYLAPNDYHRVHMPQNAILQKMTYIPGRLFTVQSWATQHIPQLFCHNERIVCLFSTEAGPMIMVLVGALFVGSIVTKWHGVVNASHTGPQREWHYGDEMSPFHQHQEMGRFQYGSTVILLFPPETIQWDSTLQARQKVKLGQVLAQTQKKI